MWTKKLQSLAKRPPAWPKPRFIRKFNGQQTPGGSHTTYFQQPPTSQAAPSSAQRSLGTFILAGTFLGTGWYLHAWWSPSVAIEVEDHGIERMQAALQGGGEVPEGPGGHVVQDGSAGLLTALVASFCRKGQAWTLEGANEFLASLALAHTIPDAGVTVHYISVPSNPISEDGFTMLSFGPPRLLGQPGPLWSAFGIFDGHAGARCSDFLATKLGPELVSRLANAGVLDPAYTSQKDDAALVEIIKKTFVETDEVILSQIKILLEARDTEFPVAIDAAAAAFSGSCALLTLFDPNTSLLRVANTGDSRAVLGRWDEAGRRYIAIPMSEDQTGFNSKEVERLQQEHPGEDNIVDPKTGRVHGIAVSRAFGDGRWKWPNEFNTLAQRSFFGPAPRSDSAIKTPPYLTAEPEVIEMKVQKEGDHPDFLIMASDGLWDNISSEHAVTCVQMWLDENKPTSVVPKPFSASPEQVKETKKLGLVDVMRVPPTPPLSSAAATDDFEDTFYDEKERCLKWRTRPKHFVAEDANCAAHLVKNSLGGRRRGLFCGIMSVQPPLSRNVRDDITVQVLFFANDGEIKN